MARPWLWFTKSRFCGILLMEDLVKRRAWGLVVLGVSSSMSKGWCLGQDGKVSCDGEHSEMVNILCLDRSLASLSALC